jgi:hypothetical protein
MFDTGMCRSYMWYPTSSASPEKAESCSMGDTAWFAIAAGVLHLWALVCVCLRNPERRTTMHSDDRESKHEMPTDEQDEEMTDDLDLEGVDKESGGIVLLENVGGDREKQKLDKELFAFPELGPYNLPSASFLMQEIIDTNQCDATELSLVNTMAGGGCCSPLSVNGTNSKSPMSTSILPTTGGPEVPMSPVDCIIDGFDIATDLSQIDICSPIVWSPTRKALQDGSTREVDRRDQQQQNQDQQTKAEFLPTEATAQAEILPARENAAVPDAGTTFLRLSEGNKDSSGTAENKSQKTKQEEKDTTQDVVPQACEVEPINTTDQS